MILLVRMPLTILCWQVTLSPEAQDKAANITWDGLWKWKVLPFGLGGAMAVDTD